MPTRRYLIEIDSTAKPDVLNAEVLRCLKERFPGVHAWADKPDGELVKLARTNPWKDEDA